jgi:hypothetical protein
MSRLYAEGHLFPSHLRRLLVALFCVFVLLGSAYAQDGVPVPRLVKFAGTITSKPSGTVGVIFALYKDQTGGAPLWQEVQNVTVDASGRYAAFLGARSANGIPVEVFSTGEARWLGIQADGQAEQTRVLLVSVPYALKASDAETLGGLPASAFLRADSASTVQSAARSTAYINTAAVSSAANLIINPLINASGAGVGYIPVFNDLGGDVSNSVLFQSGSFVGVGTTAPAALLNLVGANPTMRVDNYSNNTGDSPNFNFFTARGTAASPSAILGGDNLGQFAAAGYNGAAFPGSKVKVTFMATENWTPTANGTTMSFQTTANGTTARTERMRIDNTGYVGIGTTAPTSMLTVAGPIQSTTGGGFIFPDGTSQTSAGIAAAAGCASGQMLKWNGSNWFCFTSQAASSLTLGSGLTGSIVNNLLTLNTDTSYLQRRVGGLCPNGNAIAAVNVDGTVSCQTVSGGGVFNLPVYWTGSVNSPTGVLGVTNTVNGPAEPTNGPPTNAYFDTVPSAIVGTSTGTGITAGVRGQATGINGVGVFAYTATSNLGALLAWNGLTGYTPIGSNGDYPKAIVAELTNETGGTAIQAEASALTAPTCAQNSNNCQQITGFGAKMGATSGQTVAFFGQLNSPAATGLQLNFNVAPTSGSMINANVNCNGGSSPCPYFQVDGSGNVNTSGQMSANGGFNSNGPLQVGGVLSVGGTAVFNSQVNANSGLNVLGGSNLNGQINANGNIVVQGTSTFQQQASAMNGLVVNGNLNVNGNLSKSSGTFKIDHPLDPANKYLYHSFVESPDMMNIYNGVVLLDKHGKAIVDLPDYFEALNQDFRYQLTAVGAPGPNLYVAKEIAGNKFIIAGGKPGAKVSWQVTGIRHDAYADAHRVVPEEDKGKERGTYLHPELFKQEPVVAKK